MLGDIRVISEQDFQDTAWNAYRKSGGDISKIPRKYRNMVHVPKDCNDALLILQGIVEIPQLTEVEVRIGRVMTTEDIEKVVDESEAM